MYPRHLASNLRDISSIGLCLVCRGSGAAGGGDAEAMDMASMDMRLNAMETLLKDIHARVNESDI